MREQISRPGKSVVIFVNKSISHLRIFPNTTSSKTVVLQIRLDDALFNCFRAISMLCLELRIKDSNDKHSYLNLIGSHRFGMTVFNYVYNTEAEIYFLSLPTHHRKLSTLHLSMVILT